MRIPTLALALVLLAAATALAGGDVLPGLDVLESQGFASLQGKRVGLVTNHTGVDRKGRSAIDLLHEAKGVSLVALFSPEHGLRGAEDRPVASGRDEKTGLPVHSLYGATKRPTPEMLAPLDALVFDMQDVGARYYTYSTTLVMCMEACAPLGKEVIVLDRPDPIGGAAVEGPILEESLRGGFASYLALPTRHGMTLGEVARWYDAEKSLSCKLTVVPARGWRRAQYQDATGIPWVSPSPNMTSLEAAIHYAGLGALEATNLSVGRGTETPFLVYGAPWVDGAKLAAELQRRGIAGARFTATGFTPRAIAGRPRYPYTDQACRGVRVEVTDRAAYRPVTAALHLLDALRRLHGDAFKPGSAGGMLGRRDVLERLAAGEGPAAIVKGWEAEREAFMRAREKALLYPD